MDSAKMILTEAVSPPKLLGNLNKINVVTEEQRRKTARDFESVFINKLLDQMKNTVGKWGFEKDGAARQIQGIFTMYLSQHIADNGGFGLWEEIYKFLDNSANNTAESLDSKV